ncbi:hypothetical protein FACS1894202_13540 [Clostridia bacterium]|nr:hypothetical protein FACS1894202_13540 [Clostridia bacterium]
MKRIISILMTLVMLLMIIPLSLAEGDPNLDGGGDGVGRATGNTAWHGTGWDGVRISVVKISTGNVYAGPVDWTNITPFNGTKHFDKVSKVQYKSGTALSLKNSTYVYKRPDNAIPQIIQNSGSLNIAAIRTYFTKNQTITNIARDVGMSADTLMNGSYKLLLEPIAFFVAEGVEYAMTATESLR